MSSFYVSIIPLHIIWENLVKMDFYVECQKSHVSSEKCFGNVCKRSRKLSLQYVNTPSEVISELKQYRKRKSDSDLENVRPFRPWIPDVKQVGLHIEGDGHNQVKKFTKEIANEDAKDYTSIEQKNTQTRKRQKERSNPDLIMELKPLWK